MSRTLPEPSQYKAEKEVSKPRHSKPLDQGRLAYSMSELAHEWGVSQRSIWTLVNTGRLEAFRIGRAVRIPREAVDNYMARGGA